MFSRRSAMASSLSSAFRWRTRSEAERAVRAGLDIVEAIARLHFQGAGRLQVRIGITSGMAVVASGERNAVGETMNLAARLQTIAKPGSVVVSDSVRRMAGGEFEYEDMGEKDLKGVSGPTRVYRVSASAGPKAASRRRPARADADRRARCGNLRVARRLAAGARRPVSAGRSCCAENPASARAGWSARCASASRAMPAKPWCFNARRSSSTALFIRSGLPSNARCGSAGESTRKPGWTSLRPRRRPARPCQGRHALYRGAAFNPLSGALRRDSRLAQARQGRDDARPDRVRPRPGARRARRCSCSRTPTGPTRRRCDLLGRFVDLLAGIPTLLVVTARPEFNAPLASHPAVTVMDLAKFTPDQSGSLVANVVGGKALPPGLAAEIIARTDGVPLFVEELTKTILESGRPDRRGRPLCLCRIVGQRQDPGNPARLADGPPRSGRGEQGNRPGRLGHRPRVQLRTDRRTRTDERGRARQTACGI